MAGDSALTCDPPAGVRVVRCTVTAGHGGDTDGSNPIGRQAFKLRKDYRGSLTFSPCKNVKQNSVDANKHLHTLRVLRDHKIKQKQ